MLNVKGITKTFTQRGIVLDNLDLHINEGELVAVTGPSGSGKTTLLNLIGTLDRPEKGEIIFRDKSVLGFNSDQAAEYRNSNIGFVFQEHLLLPHLTIFQNIILPVMANPKRMNGLAEAEKYALELLTTAGIEQIKTKYPFQVSGGEAQRAALVRALINKPSLILADEPTGSLDRDNSTLLGDLILEVNRQTGAAILLVTHSIELAGKMTRKYYLEKGKLIAR